jgi:PleD family two-component response regulator
MIKNMENEMEERTNQLQSMMSELKKSSDDKQNKNAAAAELPERDSLTRLYNLFVLQQRLQEIFEASRRHSFPLSVMIIDIDNFKELNDTYGHETGNEVLLKIAELLKGSPYIPGQSYDEKENMGEIRKYDIAGRYGSDEFGVVLPYCTEETARKIAERLLQRIQSIKLSSAPEAVIRGNCGIAVLNKDTACQNSKQILSLADKALYYAKSQGKNRLHVIKFE